jgi:hypothetical protein
MYYVIDFIFSTRYWLSRFKLWNGKFLKFLLVSLVYLLTIMAFGDDLEGVGVN